MPGRGRAAFFIENDVGMSVKIRVSKGGSQLSGCQIAQNRDCFVQFDSQKMENHLLTP